MAVCSAIRSDVYGFAELRQMVDAAHKTPHTPYFREKSQADGVIGLRLGKEIQVNYQVYLNNFVQAGPSCMHCTLLAIRENQSPANEKIIQGCVIPVRGSNRFSKAHAVFALFCGFGIFVLTPGEKQLQTYWKPVRMFLDFQTSFLVVFFFGADYLRAVSTFGQFVVLPLCPL